MGLSQHVQIDQILGYSAAGTTARTTDIIDMSGFDGVVFIAEFGTVITAGTINVQVLQNSVNSTSGMTAVAGTSDYTVTASDAGKAKNCIVVDVFQPTKRFLEVTITPAAQNAVITGVTAIRYNGKVKPRIVSGLKTTYLQSPE